MKRRFALALATAPMITPPAGWKGGPDDASARTAALTPHFGGVKAGIEAARWDAPAPGVVLYATRTAADASAAAGVDAEIGALAPVGTTAKIERSVVDKTIVASIEWKDGKAGIQGVSRMVVAQSGAHVIAARGDCIAGVDANAAALAACKQALATLDVGIEAKDRIEIGAVATSPAPAAPSPMQLGDGGKPKVAPLIVAPDPSPTIDLRPVAVGAALLAMAGVFYWNRKRRDRYAAEAAKETAK